MSSDNSSECLSDNNPSPRIIIQKKTPLFIEFYKKKINLTKIKELIDAGENVNEVSSTNGNSLLILACKKRKPNEKLIKMLVAAGANVNDKEAEEGSTPLILLCQRYKYHKKNSLISFLVSSGADINAMDENYNTPLIVASHNSSHKCLLEHLIKLGADVNRADGSNNNAVLIATICNEPKLVKILIKAGCDVNKRSDVDNTPLNYACWDNKPVIAKMILEAGGVITDSRDPSHTLLTYASEKGHKKIVELLLQFGTDPNEANRYKYTPVAYAMINNHFSIIKILINAGADINSIVYNSSNTTLLEASCKKGNIDIINFLLDKDAKMISLVSLLSDWQKYEVSEDTKIKIVERLLIAGANLNEISLNNSTPIMHASHSNCERLALMLIYAGATFTKSQGECLMHNACKYNHEDLCKLLIARGVDINEKENNNKTPLMIACKYKNTKIAEILINSGADTTLFSKIYKTALIYAKENDLTSIVAILEKNSYDVCRTCKFCMKESIKNTLVYLVYNCPMCKKECDKIIVFGCGHINCCRDCWGTPG